MWNNITLINGLPRGEFSYDIDYRERFDEELGGDVLEKSIVKLCRGGELVSTTEYEGYFVDRCKFTAHGTVVYGNTASCSGDDVIIAMLARLNSNGENLWQG